MSNQNITRLVIGGDISLSMGVPVGQDLGERDVSDTLRWRDGRWETNKGILDMVKNSLTKPQNVLQLQTTRASKAFKFNVRSGGWKLAAGAAIAMVVCTAAIYAVLRHNKPNADVLSVVPDARLGAVRTVDEPWIRPAPTQPQPEPQPQPNATGIPVVPGNLGANPVEPRDAAPPVKAVVAAPEVVKRPHDSKPVEAKQEEKKPEVKPAVILDMEPTAAKAKAKEVPGVQINAAKPPVKEVPKQPTGSGLVAVTPDGKTALFTNKATRLPEKYGVGDKLPSGEVIKSIDANAGIVKTDAKEYRLE